MEPNQTILVMDDEKEIVQSYVDFLAPAPASTPKRSSRIAKSEAKSGAVEYRILRAYSGEEALAHFQTESAAGQRIACGFFDVKMDGGMDGLRTIQEIWKIDPEVHCTVVTAYHDRDVNDIDQLFGPRYKDQWDYLNKPFTQAEIIQKARQMIAAWNRKRNLEQAVETIKAQQAQLFQAERMAIIGQLARAVGHEFGNILQTIIGQADIAISQADPQKVQDKLMNIVRAGERASIITRNLLSFSKTASEKGPVDAQKVIKETLLLIHHQLTKASLEAVDATKPVAQVQGNASEIEQVLLNLIINAMHATPKQGTIEVGCEDRAGQVAIWVKDTGSGIPAEVLPRIFEYAFTTKGEKGSGLGLSISKSIVEEHQGTINVETHPGQGTTFTILLPRSS